MAVAHTHTGRIWLMFEEKQLQRAFSIPPHHSPPLSSDNSCPTPVAHHSLPGAVGCVNTTHSHIHRGRTVNLSWVSSPSLHFFITLNPLATFEPGCQSITCWWQNRSPHIYHECLNVCAINKPHTCSHMQLSGACSNKAHTHTQKVCQSPSPLFTGKTCLAARQLFSVNSYNGSSQT